MISKLLLLLILIVVVCCIQNTDIIEPNLFVWENLPSAYWPKDKKNCKEMLEYRGYKIVQFNDIILAKKPNKNKQQINIKKFKKKYQ